MSTAEVCRERNGAHGLPERVIERRRPTVSVLGTLTPRQPFTVVVRAVRALSTSQVMCRVGDHLALGAILSVLHVLIPPGLVGASQTAGPVSTVPHDRLQEGCAGACGHSDDLERNRTGCRR